MEYVIKVDETGNPVDHPMSLENLAYIHSDITLDNLPEGLEVFIRVSEPQLGAYEILVGNSGYARVDGVLQDTFEVRPMTDEEKNEKIQRALTFEHPEGWVFNYDKCAWRPVLNQSGSAPNVIG